MIKKGYDIPFFMRKNNTMKFNLPRKEESTGGSGPASQPTDPMPYPTNQIQC
jgi:hypothetical protein